MCTTQHTDSIDFVAAIEEYDNNEEEAELAKLVDEKNDDWILVCSWCFLKDLFEMRMMKKLMFHPWVHCRCLVPNLSWPTLSWTLNTHGTIIHRDTFVRQAHGQWTIFCQWKNDSWLQSVVETLSMKLNWTWNVYVCSFYGLDCMQAFIKALGNTCACQ